MKRDHNKMNGQPPKGKKEDGGGMDELLAVLGYKVKSSEMADVAQKLEQLEMAMGSFPTDGGGAITHLSDSVHYNPSDISSWIQTMLSELNPTAADTHPHPPSSSSCSSIPPSPFFNHPPPSIINSTSHPPNPLFQDNSEYDIGAVVAGYSPRPLKSSASSSSPSTSPINSNKRFKHNNDPTPTPTTPSTVTLGVGSPISDQSPSQSQSQSLSHSRPLVVVDSQEAGVRLVHTLMACAEAVQNDNLKVADALVKQIGHLAVSQAGAMRKVATYFAEGLARRIYKIRPDPSLTAIDAYASDVLQAHFYETCPYLQFAHFTANQAILEAFAGAKRVHVVDFSMKQGLQWPALIQALALRPGGPPVFRLTGIGPPQPDNTDALQEVGWKLAHFAKDLGVQFYYRGYVCENLADLDPDLLDIRVVGKNQDQKEVVEVEVEVEEEVVAVNSVCELHRLLARPGDIDRVMKNVRAMKPKIFTVAEQEANHNGPVFMERFNEALHYYSTMFDSLESYGIGGAGAGAGAGLLSESGTAAATSQDRQLSEVYLGRQICNVVACEGAERVERHETLDQWRSRFESAGFDPVHLGSNAFKQASMLLALYTGRDGYEVEENGGCLMLGWHKRSLIATSAWR